MDQVREIGRSYTVELPILSNTTSKFSFGDNETALDNVLVHALSMPTSLLIKAPSGRTLLNYAETAKGYITLADADKKEYNRQIPLELLLRNDNPIIHIKPKLISIRNCFVDLPLIGAVVIPAGPPAGNSIVFVFFYEPYNPEIHRIDSWGELIEN